MMKGRNLPVLLFLALLGCETSPRSGQLTYAVDSLPNGGILVENTGEPGWGPEDQLRATEGLRIGTVDGSGPEQFGAITGLEVDGVGSIFVGDFPSDEVRVFLSGGSFSHSFGGSGEGPEEFRNIFGMRLDPDGHLWVRDAGNNRFSVFETGGALLRSLSPGYFSRYTPWQLRVLEDHRVVDWEIRRPHDPDAENRTDMIYFPLLLSADLGSRDTLPPIVFPLDMISGMRVFKPFSQTLEYHVDPEGSIWMGSSKEYRVLRRALDGDTLLVFTLPAPPEKVSERERLQMMQDWLGSRTVPADQILDEKPVLEGVITDDEGHVLVFPHLENVPAGTAVDFFTQNGVFLGRVKLPVTLELRPEPVCRGGSLYGVTKDELDVQYVVRLDLSRGRDKTE